MSIRTLHIADDGAVRHNLSDEEWRAAAGATTGFLWVDISGDDPQADSVLTDVFKFHPLAVDDALREEHIPRIDQWEGYLYAVITAMTCSAATPQLNIFEIDLFLGEHYLVTLHREEIGAIEKVWKQAQQPERRPKRPAGRILYELLDTLTTDYLQAVDSIDEHIDALEDRIFSGPNGETLSGLFSVKRSLLEMRRMFTPMREVMNRLARDDYPQIRREERVYFRDIYDHLVRLVDLNETLRDMVSGAMDSYLSVVSNRLNEIMKTLTIVTLLFMPLTVITSFFGMNFFAGTLYQVPESPPGWLIFGGAFALCLFSVGGMVLWMRRKGWM
ncbi:MAG: magnesium/cobalt transporter CorA [Armatimonadetes bacterium]|nr:magnesium/cobalt transporter CorA [Armatimonadota bacterium]